jgi:hypothetical protein
MVEPRPIPNDDFITSRDDEILLDEALAWLKRFACAAPARL